MPHTATPKSQILDCMQQLQEKGDTTYGEHIQQLARLCLADFSQLLAEWRVPSQLPQGEPMPQVANALEQPEKLSSEQGSKLVSYLQQNAKSGNKTAILYLAYLFAKGLFVPQSPERAAAFTRKLMQEGDWRATRFWAEMLLAAPPVASIWLAAEVEPAAKQWQAAHTQLSEDEIYANINRFYAAESARKFAAKRAFELAIKQGSPTAAKRLRGLTVLGELPVSQPARQFHNIANWLDMQIMAKNQPMASDDEIYVLPENVPLLAQGEDDEKPLWIKYAVYVCLVLIFSLLFVIILRGIVAK
ncbi:hypothetical protein ACKLNO_08055 [Neisseriaceae bacterium B1]